MTGLASLAMPFAEMRESCNASKNAKSCCDAKLCSFPTLHSVFCSKRTMSLRVGFTILILLCGLCYSLGKTVNPICYVCSDGGVSTITKPDVVIPLPENAGQSEATCEMIRL